ncbi:MAG: hypothetical protein ABEH66_08315 [Halobacteriales archaeon]
MEEPRPDLKADEGEDPPDFDALTSPEALVRGERTREDFFDAVLQLDTPATVGDVAALADHGTDAAREYLDWYERMGVVTQVTESPATYRLNREYLAWRRVQRVKGTYDPGELIEFLEAATERDQEYAAEFGVDSPDEVALAEHAAESGEPIEGVWEALSAWRTTRRRIAILERALAETDADPSGRRHSIA